MRKKVKQPIDSYILISVISNLETSSWNIGKSVLSAFLESDPRLLPERVGTFEPLSNQVSSIDDCAPFWAVFDDPASPGMELNADGFLWERLGLIASSGHMMHKHRNIYGNVKPAWFVFRSSFDENVEWLKLFEKLCGVLRPEYATLNLITAIEDASDAFGDEANASYATNDYLEGIAPIALGSRGLSNLAWANFFGAALASEVREDEIRSAGFPITKFNEGFLLRITENISLIEDDFEEFSRQRIALRKLFRAGLFRINHEPRRIGGSSN